MGLGMKGLEGQPHEDCVVQILWPQLYPIPPPL